MVVRIGTAGIPLACKGGTTADAVKCVSDMGLSALEIEFVRSIYLDEKSAVKVGEVARKLDVSLSCHAPYYINFASIKPAVVFKSRKIVGDALRIADACRAGIVVVHAGFYSGRGDEETYRMIKSALSAFSSRAKVGVETMGRQKQFGSVDEVARLVGDCENVLPVVDFAHVHARGNGCIRSKDDFKGILDKFERLGVSPIHCHMTGIKYENGNEKHHLPLSSNEPDFRLLAEVLRENEYNVTVICESPLIEQDAALFKGWVDLKN